MMKMLKNKLVIKNLNGVNKKITTIYNNYFKTKEGKEEAKKLLSQSKGNLNINKNNTNVNNCKELFLTSLWNEIDNMSNTDNTEFKELLKSCITCESEQTSTGVILHISFDENKLKRSSLYPEKYPDEIYLPEIFNNGYCAKATVYASDGYVGKYTVSKKIKKPSYFINLACQTFNNWAIKNDYNYKAIPNHIYSK